MPLPNDAELVIGRAEDADVRLVADSVSRRHALLRVRSRELTIEDLGSSNGTLVRGQPVAPDRVGVPATSNAVLRTLTGRELDVLRLVGQGRDNTEVATALSLSVRTVERHLTSVYAKLGLSGRAARAGAVARLLGSG